MSKQYGLILPNKDKTNPKIPATKVPTRPSIFDEDSDSDNANEINKPTGFSKSLKRQDKLTQEKAVEEDPTVYQYDEIYDEMDQKRQESKLSRKDLDKKPKYINKLLAAADRRKRENERRIEREVQKEREAEGEQYKDKEAFVTTAYKKKLEEMKLLEEQEKREEYLETIGDVTKQGNLDGFYRHLYDQKINYDEKDAEKDGKKVIKTESETVNTSEHLDEDSADVKLKDKKTTKSRNFRKREHSNSDHDDVEVKKEHLPSNLDADSDFSIDSSDSEDDDNPVKSKKEDNKTKENSEKDESVIEAKTDDKENVSTTKDEIKEEDTIESPKVKKPKIDIWKKRTVGEVFDAALQRYFERKALREAGN